MALRRWHPVPALALDAGFCVCGGSVEDCASGGLLAFMIRDRVDGRILSKECVEMGDGLLDGAVGGLCCPRVDDYPAY